MSSTSSVRSASAAQPIAFKIELKRKARDPTFHRFSGQYTFSELNTVIAHLWGERPKHLVLDYTDDEGDQVRLSTEPEWEECVRIFRTSNASVLRLTGKRSKDDKNKREKQEKVTCEEGSDSDLEEGTAACKEAQSTASCVPNLPAIHQPKVPLHMDPICATAATFLDRLFAATAATAPHGRDFKRESPQSPGSTATNSATPTDTATPPMASCCGSAPSSTNNRSAAPKIECDANNAAVDLMSLLYQCDAKANLFSGAVEKFGSVIKRVVNPFMPTEVHLDIDRLKLYREVVVKGNAMIDARQLQEAEQLLRNALVVFADSVILEYNLACVLSLQERLEEAIELLLAAKGHGYDDLEHLRTDPDLENVRKHARFAEVVPPAESVPSPEPAQESPVVSEPEIPAPVAESVPPPAPCGENVSVEPTPVVDPQVLTLLSIFPDMSLQEAECAMKRVQGNLARAVNARLSGQ